MGKYEQLAIDLLESAFGDRWVRNDSRVFSLGPDAGTGEVDGTIDGRIAVEIGVGSPKQVRASVLDLALHPYPRKLLILVDTPGHSTERSVDQARVILERMSCTGLVYRFGPEDEMDVLTAELTNVTNGYIGETEEETKSEGSR